MHPGWPTIDFFSRGQRNRRGKGNTFQIRNRIHGGGSGFCFVVPRSFRCLAAHRGSVSAYAEPASSDSTRTLPVSSMPSIRTGRSFTSRTSRRSTP
jgi:hypothetical protein